MKSSIKLLLILLVWCISFSTNAQCPTSLSDYTYLGELGDNKYFISNTSTNWSTAESNAEANSGYLVSITSQEENDFILDKIDEIVFIGYNDGNSEGNFEWDSGEPLGFNKFADINSSNRDFGKMNFWNGNWGLDGPNVNRKYIVEIPCGGGTQSNLTLNCPDDVTIQVPSGSNTGVAVWDAPTTDTDCSINDFVTITQTDGPDIGTALLPGTYTVSYSATDACATNVNCSFLITVEDNNGGGGDCPNSIQGFTLIGELGDSKYFLSNDNAKPEDAQTVAASNGGYLAVISSEEENEFLQQNIDIMTYIGLNDVASEGNLEWVNGESVNYNNINPCGFCEENSENQDYVIMAPWNGTWSFSSQFNARPYVIEIPCSGGVDECSFVTIFSTSDAGSTLPIASISENISNSTYDLFTGDVDNTIGGEVVKYPINTSDGQLQNPVSITRAGSVDETEYSTYWDLESNILYLTKIVSSDLILLLARDNQTNNLFSQNIDISDINFGETINIKVVNNEIILVGNSGTSQNLPVIKTDIIGNLIWKKEIVHNIPDNVSIDILGASNAGGFYLFYDFFGNTVFKFSDAGDLEWDANVNENPISGEFTFRIGEGGDQRFYMKRINTNSYLAAFDVNTGALVWDFRAEEVAAANEGPNATVIGTVITEALPTLDGGVILFYDYDVLQPVGPPNTVKKLERYDADGNLVWSRNPQLPFLLGRTKLAASDGGFIFSDPVNFNSDDWRIVRMTSEGFFEPDCDDVVIDDECFNTAFSTAAAGPVKIRKFLENTSNSTYEVFSKETNNFLERETNKYAIDAITGELESTTTITRLGSADESDFETYWDTESNILYGVKDISADLITLWAKDSQGDFIFSKNIDVSDLEFVFPYVRVVHNELILTASSTTSNTFPIIKTDINGNLIWKKEIPSNVQTGIGIFVFSESKDGGFYLFHQFGGAIAFKLSAAGDLEWTGDLTTPDPSEFLIILGESGDGQRFYIKRLSFGLERRAYLAAFDVNTGNISWDYNGGESDAGGVAFGSTIYQVIPANDGGAAVFYQYNLSSDPNEIIYRHKRFDGEGNVIWERDTPEGIPAQIGENKLAGSDGGFVVAGESFNEPDTWRVVRMTEDGYFAPDCGNTGGGNCATFIPGPIAGFTYKANVGTKYYYLSDDVARPTDAQANCVSNGGNLASVTSQEIADALTAETNGFVYIGMHDEDTEGTLEWRSGTNVNFTNFDDCSICESNSESRDYVVMQGWNGKWSWNGFFNNRRYWLEIDCNNFNANNLNSLIALPVEVEKEHLDFQNIVPNPASNHIFVQIKSKTAMAIDIEIYDARGMLLKSQPAELFDGINAVEIDIADLPGGFYLVKIPQMKGQFTTKRFVKVRE